MALVVKNTSANAGDMRCEFDPWVGKILWNRAWQPTSVFLPGESHGQRSLLLKQLYTLLISGNLRIKRHSEVKMELKMTTPSMLALH